MTECVLSRCLRKSTLTFNPEGYVTGNWQLNHTRSKQLATGSVNGQRWEVWAHRSGVDPDSWHDVFVFYPLDAWLSSHTSFQRSATYLCHYTHSFVGAAHHRLVPCKSMRYVLLKVVQWTSLDCSSLKPTDSFLDLCSVSHCHLCDLYLMSQARSSTFQRPVSQSFHDRQESRRSV